MTPDYNLLLAPRLPARLMTEQVAVLLGCQPHDIPVLVAGGLLQHLGQPTASCVKYFHSTDIVEKTADRKWQHRATNCIYRYWRNQNTRRRKKQQTEEITP